MSESGLTAQLATRARAAGKRIVLPEVTDERIQGARRALERSGDCEVLWIEDPSADPRFEEAVEHLWARRKAKGLDRDGAAALAARPLHFGACLVALGHADGSVAGAAHATAEVIRAGIHCVGTAPDSPLVSSFFLFARGDEFLSYADCGVVPEPSIEERVGIARATATNHRLLTGQDPRVAFLSFSTKGSAEHPRTAGQRDAAERFRTAHPEIPADGELQFDAAYVPEVAARKAPDSALAGRANVFVFPDLDSGNIAYKITERLGGFAAFGPLIQGLARPCLDLSRGCSADDVVTVAHIAAVMAGPR